MNGPGGELQGLISVDIFIVLSTRDSSDVMQRAAEKDKSIDFPRVLC